MGWGPWEWGVDVGFIMKPGEKKMGGPGLCTAPGRPKGWRGRPEGILREEMEGQLYRRRALPRGPGKGVWVQMGRIQWGGGFCRAHLSTSVCFVNQEGAGQWPGS